MQCLTGTILVILLIQNTLGQDGEDPGCGDQPKALNNYMRRLNNAENEVERSAEPQNSDEPHNSDEPQNSEDPNDPKSRMSMMTYKRTAYYPSKSRGIKIVSPTGWLPPVSFQYDMTGGMNMNAIAHTIKYKVNIPMDDILHRLFKFYMEWPAIKSTLEIRHMVSFRDVLRAAFECMYPEWGSMKLNMIFGSINDETVLKHLFLALFPNWPQREINDIFSVGNTIPLIIRKLLMYLVPDITPQEIHFIFSNTRSVKVILQRICEVLFPFMKQSGTINVFDMSNSVTNIFDGLLHGFFPSTQTPQPVQWDTVYTVLFPGMTYNIKSHEPNLSFLLAQYKNFQSMPIEPSKRENVLMLILLEWLKQNPTVQYKLPRPGMDDFNNFKFTFFQNAPPNAIVPQEFHDDNLLREMFALWKRFIVGHHPNDKLIDLRSIRDFLTKFIRDRIIDNNPNVSFPPTPYPTFTPVPTMSDIPITITIAYIENLKDILPPEMITPLIELFNLPDKSKSGPLIMRILSNWQKLNNLNNRVPLSKLMKLILRIIASNWPDVDVERVVGVNLNLEQILMNLFKVMFLEWPDVRLEGKINSPQFILEMLLKKALPNIPKQKIEFIVSGHGDMERVLFRIKNLLYPGWPLHKPSNIQFDAEVMEKMLAEIINWPQTKSTIIAKGTVSIPLLLESFIHAIFPSWPQYVVSMITVGRVPLPLIVQKIVQVIATKGEDKELVLHYDEHSPMVEISEALFRLIFPDWPNYSAVLNIQNRIERNTVLGQSLKVVYGSMAKHENSLKCLNDRDSNWAFTLFIGLLNYVQQESLTHSMKLF